MPLFHLRSCGIHTYIHLALLNSSIEAGILLCGNGALPRLRHVLPGKSPIDIFRNYSSNALAIVPLPFSRKPLASPPYLGHSSVRPCCRVHLSNSDPPLLAPSSHPTLRCTTQHACAPPCTLCAHSPKCRRARKTASAHARPQAHRRQRCGSLLPQRAVAVAAGDGGGGARGS
jgi:hypothetical protein